MITFTKDELTLLRHGLDLACRQEGGGLGQAGLKGLADGRAKILSDRLAMAADLDTRFDAEYAAIEEAEKAAAAAKPKEE